MIKKPEISVIVPVYKVGKYLEQCLDSILDQTFEDWECILVDDGSPDNSGRICDEYAEKHSRFRVIHKVNGGVSSARNAGLSCAEGKWIFFSDSDDFLSKDCLEKLIRYESSDIDIIESGYKEIFDNDKERILDFTDELKIFSNIDYISLFYFEDKRITAGYHGYPWNKLFRKSVIDKHKLEFDASISFKEDTLFIIQYACVMKGKAAIVPGVIYDHIYRDSGAMVRYKSFNKLTTSRVDAIMEIHKVIHDRFLGEIIDEASERDIAKAYLIARGIAIQNKLSHSELLKECKEKVIECVGRKLIIKEILIQKYYWLRHWLNPLTYIRNIRKMF